MKKPSILSNARVTGLVSIIGILLLYLVVIGPMLGKRSDILREIAAAETSFTAKQALLNRSGEFKKEFAPYQEKLSTEKGSSIENVDALFLKQIEKLLQSAGLLIVDVKVLPMKEDGGNRKHAIQLEVEGNIDRLTILLDAIANTQDLYQLDHLSLERKDTTSDILRIVTVFSLTKLN